MKKSVSFFRHFPKWEGGYSPNPHFFWGTSFCLCQENTPKITVLDRKPGLCGLLVLGCCGGLVWWAGALGCCGGLVCCTSVGWCGLVRGSDQGHFPAHYLDSGLQRSLHWRIYREQSGQLHSGQQAGELLSLANTFLAIWMKNMDLINAIDNGYWSTLSLNQPLYLCSTYRPTTFPAGWPVSRTLYKVMPCVKVPNFEIVGFVFFVSYSSWRKNLIFMLKFSCATI